MRRIILLGPPGAGKGTQGMRLARHFRVPHFATGDLLRDALRRDKNGEVGQAARVISGGDMVSDSVANALVFDRLGTAPRGWVLDGYPRTRAQAETLHAYLQARGEMLHAVLALSVTEETVLVRLGGRLVCSLCAASFHRHDSPPKSDGVCDGCGGELVVRPDDTPSGIQRRLDLYQTRTAPLADWFREKGLLCVVSGEGHADAILARCLQAAGTAASYELGGCEPCVSCELKETLV